MQTGSTTANDILVGWIRQYGRLCIATKRGINGAPHYVWTNDGWEDHQWANIDKRHILEIIHCELDKFVDMAWIGGPFKQNLGVAMMKDGVLTIEPSLGLVSLDSYYPSFI